MGIEVWSVQRLGAFYTEHRSELLAHANRVLKDSAKAEEITQDALIKFMLAAPELQSEDHALSYLHRTIENLCMDIFRMEGRRPSLVVIDDAQAEIEAQWQVNGDHSEVISAAEDAAIVRQALAMLSPAERAALVMWEMEGRSTEEIAAELGIKESAVRHTVSRARSSLRRVLSELVIDEERGLTALDMLSTSYRKAAELAQKSSKVALSLLLVVTAFLGFNSMTGREAVLAPTSAIQSVDEAAPSDAASSGSVASQPSPTLSSPATTKPASFSGVNVKSGNLTFLGLDADGIPTGFSITDASSSTVGKIRVAKNSPIQTDEGTILSTVALTAQGGPNVLIDQTITVDGNGTSYEVNGVTIGQNKVWVPLKLGAISSGFERLSNGQYLLTVTISVVSTGTLEFAVPTGDRGYDLKVAPKVITSRLLLNPGKTQILAQAILVDQNGK